MKVDPHLTIVKGPQVSGSNPKRLSRPAGRDSQDGVVSLISQENRRAWRINPDSLTEAKKVLERLQCQLGRTQEDTLAEVHHLDVQCLVRLR